MRIRRLLATALLATGMVVTMPAVAHASESKGEIAECLEKAAKVYEESPKADADKSKFDDLTAQQYEAAELNPDAGDYAMTVDLDWENIFTTQITKLLSVNLYIRWVYDKYDNSVPPVISETGTLTNPGHVRAAIRKAGQLKQTLSLGITYRLL